MVSIHEVLDLEQIDRDIFRGSVIKSILQRTFGGQAADQSLATATRTMGNTFAVNSLHAHLVGPGRPHIPTVCTVERIRGGRSFCHRSVETIRGGRTIFVMWVSFHHKRDEGLEHSDMMRKMPDPEDVVTDTFEMTNTRRLLIREWVDWDIQVMPDDQFEHNKYASSQQLVWFRCKDRLPGGETFHVRALAYMLDMTLLSSALVPHPDVEVQEASLNHAMWFMRPLRADEWLLYDQISPSAHAGRALTHDHIFNQKGELMAVVTQEGLTRSLAPGVEPVPVAAGFDARSENLNQ